MRTRGGQTIHFAFVWDIEIKVLKNTVMMYNDPIFNEGLARLGRSGFHLLRGRNFFHWFWQGKFSIKTQRLWRTLMRTYKYVVKSYKYELTSYMIWFKNIEIFDQNCKMAFIFLKFLINLKFIFVIFLRQKKMEKIQQQILGIIPFMLNLKSIKFFNHVYIAIYEVSFMSIYCDA
jgi:hypothetical protein